jgi:hypothetical protein
MFNLICCISLFILLVLSFFKAKAMKKEMKITKEKNDQIMQDQKNKEDFLRIKSGLENIQLWDTSNERILKIRKLLLENIHDVEQNRRIYDESLVKAYDALYKVRIEDELNILTFKG